MKNLDDIKRKIRDAFVDDEKSAMFATVDWVVDYLHSQGLLMVWNTDMDSAPCGYYEIFNSEIKGKVIEHKVFKKEHCFVFLNKNTYYTHKLEDGRWNGFTKEQTGDAWMPLPKVEAVE